MLKKEEANPKIKYKNVHTKNKGITLIALVITIIVLLILAGVSINILIGENGLLTKSQDAANENTKGGARDKVATSVYASYNTDYNPDDLKLKIDEETLKTNIEKADGKILSTSTTEEGFEVIVEMDGYIYIIDENGNINEGEYTSEEKSYVGYYADLDPSHEGPEGIIYADLAVGSELALGAENKQEGVRKWNNNDWSVYEYDAVEEKSDLKKYIVGSKEVTGFGTTWKKPMITETSGGGTTERFYVMALKDFDDKTHTWYANAYEKLTEEKQIPYGTNDFKEGKANTKYWINVNEGKENASFQDESKYGALKDSDIWKLLNENLKEYGREWFVPSKSEWSAFGDMCYTLMKMTTDSSSYNQTFGLNNYYWLSSQQFTFRAYYANFDAGFIHFRNVDDIAYVRMSATF